MDTHYASIFEKICPNLFRGLGLYLRKRCLASEPGVTKSPGNVGRGPVLYFIFTAACLSKNKSQTRKEYFECDIRILQILMLWKGDWHNYDFSIHFCCFSGKFCTGIRMNFYVRSTRVTSVTIVLQYHNAVLI